MTNPVELVKIVDKESLYRDGEPAQSIELISFEFVTSGEKCGYQVVSQKNLYSVGDTAYFIQPDYCLSNNELFESFIAPGGDPKKTRLGKNNRIRAIKFNFTKKDESLPVYSFGILLQKDQVLNFLRKQEDTKKYSLDVILGISKYEEPEGQRSGLAKGTFPSFMYKTDEENVNNFLTLLEDVIQEGEELGFSEKIDGSSYTAACRKNADGVYEVSVYSRSLEKNLDQRQVLSYADRGENIYTPYFDKKLNKKGWYSKTTDLFYTTEEIGALTKQPYGSFVKETKTLRDSWVDMTHKYNLLETLPKLCEELGEDIAIRGELNGQGLKGSGNKNNPSANKPANLYLFGVDRFVNGIAVRVPYNDSALGLPVIANRLDIPYAKNIWQGIAGSKGELEEQIKGYFAQEKAKGRLVEGVVIRTSNNNKLSVKYMSAEYDSKK